jgi:hypothetical protein
MQNKIVRCIYFILFMVCNDANKISDYMASNDKIMDSELEGMWMETAVAKFKVVSRYLLERLRTTTASLSQNNQSPGRDLDPGPLEYEAGLLATRL